MSAKEGRTTIKFFTVGQLVDLLGTNEDEFVGYMKLGGLTYLVEGQHTLPMLYLKQNYNGTYSAQGDMTKSILRTLMSEMAEQTYMRKRRLYRETLCHVLIFEPCSMQDEVIKAYSDLGVI